MRTHCLLNRPRRRWQGIIKMCIEEIACVCEYGLESSYVVCNTVAGPREHGNVPEISIKIGNFYQLSSVCKVLFEDV